MKISTDRTREQDYRNIRVNNVHKVIIGTLNMNYLASKFGEDFSGIFDILIITDRKLHNTFPTSQLYIEIFPMPYRLDRNRNGGGIVIYVREDIPTKIPAKHNLSKDIEGIFLEIIFLKVQMVMVWNLSSTFSE